MRRAEEIFEDPLYIHVVRNPYANIHSMKEEAVTKEFLEAGSAEQRALFDEVMWEESEQLWAKGNANVLDFFREIPAQRGITVRYEDLLRQPAEAAAKLCAFLGLPPDASMAEPFTAENVATFSPAVAGGKGATDPKLLTNTRIEASMADAWIKAPAPKALSRFAAHVAGELGYELPAWKEPDLRASAPRELVRLNRRTAGAPLVLVHDAAGTPTRFAQLAARLDRPVFALQMPAQLRGAAGVEALADAYWKALQSLALPRTGVLLGGAGFGCRVAHAMARMAGTEGRPPARALLLLDGAAWGPLALPSHVSQYSLFCAAAEGVALASATAPSAPPAPAPADAAESAPMRPPELPSLGAFSEALRAMPDADSQLDYVATFRPLEVEPAAWDVRVDGVLHCVHACARIAAQQQAPPPPFTGRAVLLLSSAGQRDPGGFQARWRIAPARCARVQLSECAWVLHSPCMGARAPLAAVPQSGRALNTCDGSIAAIWSSSSATDPQPALTSSMTRALLQEACRQLCPALEVEQLAAEDDLLSAAAAGATATAVCRALGVRRVAVGAAEEEALHRPKEEAGGPSSASKSRADE